LRNSRPGEGCEPTDLTEPQNDKYLLTNDKSTIQSVSFYYQARGRFMKRGSILFLRAVLVLTGIGALALLLWEPHIEGRNAHATAFEIYFKDPFLAYVYVASIALFVALYQAFKALGYVGQNKMLSAAGVRRLRTIKHCALVIIGFVVGAELFIMLGNSDDRAGGVFMGVLIAFASTVIVTAMAVLERILQNAVDIKSENDLTV
jgi:hypothetical protein